MSGVLGTIIGAGAATANAAISAGASSSMNRQTRKFNEKMWNLTNEYNRPVNQMNRMLQAGISPSAAAAGIAGANYSPDFLTAQDVSGEFGATIQRGLGQAADISAHADLLRAQAENLDANTENVNEDTKGKSIDNEYKPRINDASLTKLVNEGEVQGHLADMYKSDASFRDALNQCKVDELSSLASKYKKEYDLLEQDIINKQQEVTESIARIKKMLSEEAVNYSQAKKNRFEARLLAYEGDLKKLQKTRDNIRTEVYQRIGVDPASEPVLSAYLDSDNPEDFLDGISRLKEAENEYQWNLPTSGGFGIPALFEKGLNAVNRVTFGKSHRNRGFYGEHSSRSGRYRSLYDVAHSF